MKWKVVLRSILVAFLVAAGFGLRVYKIDGPVADWHSHRQADTASVTREFVKQGVNFLIPKYHDLSNVQSGQDNPQGYRMVEAPFYNLLGLLVYRVDGNLELSMRWVSIVLSFISAIYIYLISKQLTRSAEASLLSAGVFWLLPYNVYYSRTILPEPLAIVTMLMGIYYFRKQWFLSAVAMAISVLVKPYTGLLIAPLFLYWMGLDLWKERNFKTVLKYFFYGLVALAPFGAWRWWIQKFPTGIPSSAWLFNDSDKPVLPTWWHGMNMEFINRMVAFRPSWFRWLFIERLSKLILGIFGILPFYLGLALKKGRNYLTGALMMAGVLLYFVVVAGGNLRHDYYQALTIPFLALLTGWGCYYMANFVFNSKFWGVVGTVVILALSWYVGWDQIKNYYVINNWSIVEAGKKVDEMLPKDAMVVAPYMGDTAFLYQTNRRGWPTEIYNVEEIRKEEAGRKIYLVSVNYDTYTNKMMEQYNSLYKSDKFIILDLNNEK